MDACVCVIDKYDEKHMKYFILFYEQIKLYCGVLWWGDDSKRTM